MIAVGAGVAIGSGVFRVPGNIAAEAGSTGWIIAAWLVAGLITMIQSLVTAELATRHPQAGGEYQFLKHAYGDFAAFLFGWCCVIFISGAGIGAIAATMSDFFVALFNLEGGHRTIATIAVILVIAINCFGLRSGAVTQNVLTALKILAVIGIAGGALWYAGRLTPKPAGAAVVEPMTWSRFVGAILLAYWPYTGTTDSVRLAEEVRDARRALPRALIGTTLLVMLVYVAYNYALLCAATPQEMAGRQDAHTLAFVGSRLPIRPLILAVGVVICLSAISSAALANSRIIFAMARDGLAFSWMATMSKHQSPVPALVLIGVVAVPFAWNKSFEENLNFYFLASAVLFGMVYLSLLVLRRRDAATPGETVYRLPSAPLFVGLLVVFELALGTRCIVTQPQDSQKTLAVFAALGVTYLVVRRRQRGTRRA